MGRPLQIINPPAFSILAMGPNLRHLVQCRDLLYVLTAHRINVRYKQSALGYLWALLQPLMLMLIYTAIFSYLVKVPTQGKPYAIFAYSALLPWTYFSNGLSSATAGLVAHSNLLSKVYFPREIVPLSYVTAAFVDFLTASFVLSLLMVYYGIPITVNILWALPAIVTLTIFLSGMALLVSGVQVRFRDVGMALPAVLQVWMFATPVVYSLSSVPARLRFWYELNPLVGVMETFRGALLYGAAPDLALLGRSFLISLIVALGAYIWFKHVETWFADVI